MKDKVDNILIKVKNLKTYFYTEDGIVPAVDDVSFTVNRGEVLGIVGESGCGKSITSLSIMRLVPSPPGKVLSGEIIYNGKDLLKLKEQDMTKIRGNDIAMIFQEPMTSLNPVFTIGNQIAEALILHQKLSRKDARAKAIDMLKIVKMPMPEKRIDEFPHQLSGGMRQRVMIAMALCCNPDLLICDEPTTALDVTIQAQILSLIVELRQKLNTSVMLITHDLGVVAETADNVLVMYAGKVVEYASVEELFNNPLHPYTLGLMNCIPRLDLDREELSTIRGTVPNLNNMPKGCLFSSRCDYAQDICSEKVPDLINKNGHQVRCFKYTEQWGKGE